MRVHVRAAIAHPAEEAFRRIEKACVCKAKRGDETAMLDLLVRFRPLFVKCARRSGALLPCEERGILLAQVHYEFLLLVHEFEPERGAPFAGYIGEMLPRRVLNWAHKEQCHLRREVIYGQSESEETAPEGISCAAWPGCNARPEEHEETELRIWWEQVLAELSPRQRHIMELTLQGLTEREIARRLTLSDTRAHQLKYKAQKQLQKKW